MTRYRTFINYSKNPFLKSLYPFAIVPHTIIQQWMSGRIKVLYSASSMLSGNVVFKQFIIPTDCEILLQVVLPCVFQVRLLFIIRLKSLIHSNGLCHCY